MLLRVIILLVALGTTGVLAVGSAVADDEDVLIWTTWTGPSLDWLESEVAAFARTGDLTYRIEQFTLGELRGGVMQDEGAGRKPDVLVGVPHDEISELVASQLLLDLRSFATSAYLADLPSQAAQAFAYGERLLGLPLTLEGPALLVNTSLVDSLPATYEEFAVDAGRRGLGLDFGNFYFTYAWFKGAGAELSGRDGEPWFDADAALLGARSLQDLRFVHRALGPGSDYLSAHTSFRLGEVAYMFDGPWAVAAYFEAGVPLTVMPLPELLSGVPFSGFMTVTGVLVTEEARDRTVAANVAKWLVRSDAQLQLARQAGRIPASIRAADSLDDDDLLHGFGLALRYADAVPVVPLMAASWQPFGRLLQELDESLLSDDQLRELLANTADQITVP